MKEWSGLEFGVRWMPIPGSTPREDGQQTKALVISCDMRYAVEAEKFVWKAWDPDKDFFSRGPATSPHSYAP